MFVALTAAGTRLELLSHVQAAQLQATGTAIFCPSCGARLLIRNGTQVPAHFAHRGTACPSWEPESTAHLQGKLILRDLVQAAGWQATLEVPVADGAQRVDVMAQRGATQLALEYQCSPLAADRLRERVAGYAALGLADRWYLGRHFYTGRARQAARPFARMGPQGLFWYFLDSQAGRAWVEQAPPGAPRTQQDCWPARGPAQPTTLPGPGAQAQRLAQQLHRPSRGLLRQLQNACYERGLNLAGCPWVVHRACVPRAGWRGDVTLLRVLWLLTFSGAPVLTGENGAFWARHFAADRLPLVDGAAYCAQYAAEWSNVLVAAGYLTPISAGWAWRRQPQWFPDVDQKLQAGVSR